MIKELLHKLFGGREPFQAETTAAINGEPVIFAVPYPVVDSLIADPLHFETFAAPVVPVGSFAAAEIQAKLPGSPLSPFPHGLRARWSAPMSWRPSAPRSSAGSAASGWSGD